MIAAPDVRQYAQRNRGTIFSEDATVISVEPFADQQFVMRLQAPKCARAATAGSFAHIQCSIDIPMRRPLSIMRANADAGWIEILFKVVGGGLAALAGQRVGTKLAVLGPIGQGFEAHAERPNTILIGGGVGIPPMVFLAEQLLADGGNWTPTVFMGSEIPFPFAEQRSTLECAWLGTETNRCMPLLESWGVVSRLASLAGYAGCHQGFVTDLARTYLATASPEQLQQTEIFSCGPTPMLRAVAELAAEFALPCQVSLEEFMACAVGGCAGCAVEVQTPAGPAMKRVCVDGPVFTTDEVFPQ